MSSDTETEFDEQNGQAAQPAQPDPAPAPEAAPASSDAPPAAEASAEPKTALEAALKALAAKQPADPPATAQPVDATPDTKPAQPEAPEADQSDALTDVPRLPPDVFRLLPQEARAAFNALRKQVGALRPDAERGQAVARYMQASGVTPQEFADLQDAGALMKRDPAKAREVLLRHLDKIDTALGLKLPDDIREGVETGTIDEASASEFAKARAERDAYRAELEARERAAASAAMTAAVMGWEERTRRTDADLERKLPSIMREVELALTKRKAAGISVATPEEAVDIVQQAYAATEKMLAPFRRSATPVPASPSSAASPAAPRGIQPRNSHEAAMQALGWS